jgi:hypothetical protein
VVPGLGKPGSFGIKPSDLNVAACTSLDNSQDAITALSRSVPASVVRNVTAAQDAPT